MTKFQIPNSKFQIPKVMRREKVYDLEERTYRFARDCRLLMKQLPRTLNNLEDGRQLIKASGSVGGQLH
jgi:hypothetical protein